MIVEREFGSGDLVESRVCPLTELDEAKDAPLARLTRYWFALPRSHGVLPDIDSVGLTELTRLGVLGWFHLVDVANDDPAKYRYDLFALRGIGGYPGQRLCDIPSKALRRALERDLTRAKNSQFPLFQGVRADLSSHRRDYRRVALPFSNGLNDVTHLLLGVHFDQ